MGPHNMTYVVSSVPCCAVLNVRCRFETARRSPARASSFVVTISSSSTTTPRQTLTLITLPAQRTRPAPDTDTDADAFPASVPRIARASHRIASHRHSPATVPMGACLSAPSHPPRPPPPSPPPHPPHPSPSQSQSPPLGAVRADPSHPGHTRTAAKYAVESPPGRGTHTHTHAHAHARDSGVSAKGEGSATHGHGCRPRPSASWTTEPVAAVAHAHATARAAGRGPSVVPSACAASPFNGLEIGFPGTGSEADLPEGLSSVIQGMQRKGLLLPASALALDRSRGDRDPECDGDPESEPHATATVQVKITDLTLPLILGEPALLSHFMSLLLKQFAEENIIFLKTLGDLRQIVAQSDATGGASHPRRWHSEAAREIRELESFLVSEFLMPNSPMEINIRSGRHCL